MYFGKEIKLFCVMLGCTPGSLILGVYAHAEELLAVETKGIFRSHCIAYDNKPKKLNWNWCWLFISFICSFFLLALTLHPFRVRYISHTIDFRLCRVRLYNQWNASMMQGIKPFHLKHLKLNYLLSWNLGLFIQHSWGHLEVCLLIIIITQFILTKNE